MKHRKGFVSNSSSSSFILGNKKEEHTVDSVYETLQQMYLDMYWQSGSKKEQKELKRRFRNILFVFGIDKTTDKQKVADQINDITYWGFKRSDMKDGIWIVSNGDNAIPYEFMEKIEEHFGVSRKHLG